MRSALTSALAGDAQPPPKREQTQAPMGLLSDPAFPCLRHAKGEVVEAVQSGSGYEETPDVASMSLPGTAPSTSLKKGMVRASSTFRRRLAYRSRSRSAPEAAADARRLPAVLSVRSSHGRGAARPAPLRAPR